ncbi:hypothetical protein [Flavobacterium sp.]|jgi:hypothetical protein|uniref:hypothetical protein n=1 Tax=Flavobacterium sp. TaxID=239 RepID=UPI0037C01FA2
MEKLIANKKLLLVLSSSMLLYWLLSKTIDVYQITIIGVLYEIIWLPMLVLFIVLPILNTYSLIKNKNNFMSYFSLALNIITLLIVFLV